MFVGCLFIFFGRCGMVILSGDAGINNAVDGSSGAPINVGNRSFFANVLGNHKNVLIHNRFVPQETGQGTTALSNFFNTFSGVTSVTIIQGAR